MKKLLRSVVFAGLTAGLATPAIAGELSITMSGGRVTVIAQDVPLRQILAEWARIGNTRIVHAEKLTGGPLTLQLVDVPEKQALDILLRSAAGFITAARATPVEGASVYDRVIILATSRPPVGGVTAAPAPFNNRASIAPQLPPQPPPDDDNGEPGDQGPMIPPGMQNPGMPFNPANVPANSPNAQPALTSPRPGQLPVQPQPNQMNPYAPIGRNGRPMPMPTTPGPIPGGRGGGPGTPPGETDR